MRYEWFIASRYLKGVHRGRVRISTAGVAIGVMVLIVVVSVMNGFRTELLSKMLGAMAHVRMTPVDDHGAFVPLFDFESWIERFERRPGVMAVSPAIEAHAVLASSSLRGDRSKAQMVLVRGIEPVYESGVNDLSNLLLGDWGMLADAEPISATAEAATSVDPMEIPLSEHPIFLGVELAKYLFEYPEGAGWLMGDEDRLLRFLQTEVMGRTLNLILTQQTRGPAGTDFFSMPVRVRGIFKTGHFQFDSQAAFTGLETARIFKEMPESSVEFLQMAIADPDEADRLGMRLSKWAEEESDMRFWPVSWKALNPVLLEAIKIEKVVMSTILMMVVLVAAFGISSTLVMTVIEKTREIGALMSMGTRRRSVMAIFVFNGFLVGLYGMSVGVILGLAICRLIEFLEIPLPGGGDIYVLDLLPVRIEWLDVFVIAFFALAASTLAGVYPAWKAAGLHPVEALRHE